MNLPNFEGFESDTSSYECGICYILYMEYVIYVMYSIYMFTYGLHGTGVQEIEDALPKFCFHKNKFMKTGMSLCLHSRFVLL
jgi:hypothetical protein